MCKVLVLGGSGLVGSAIVYEMNKNCQFDVYATYLHNPLPLNPCRNCKLDIEDPDNIDSILESLKPQIVISCLRGDYKKQLTAHEKIAGYLKKSCGRLYFFSTANVFDNDLSRPHYEDDMPSSCTDYGQYKIECEKRIMEILDDSACILRLPQVWGKDSRRMNELLNSLKSNGDIVVYSKLLCNSNTDVMIAKQTNYIIENDLKGIFHLGTEDIMNQKDFYHELIKGLNYNNVSIVENLEEEGCFALMSKRYDEFPMQLKFTNRSVIEYLIGR